MLIDWFTVIAQIVNFLILVWLLKRFLYQPILNAIDAREKRIATELADADTKRTEAKTAHDEFIRKNEDFDRQRAALMTQALDTVRIEREKLLHEAHQAADAFSAQRHESLKTEARNLNQAIIHGAQQEVFAIARKTLMDLATTSLEERLVEVFSRRLNEMDDKVKIELANTLTGTSDPALVRTAYDLPEAQRAAIQSALDASFQARIALRFETAPDLVSGIELTSNGHKVAWSIADYLVSLEKQVDQILSGRDKSNAPEHGL